MPIRQSWTDPNSLVQGRLSQRMMFLLVILHFLRVTLVAATFQAYTFLLHLGPPLSVSAGPLQHAAKLEPDMSDENFYCLIQSTISGSNLPWLRGKTPYFPLHFTGHKDPALFQASSFHDKPLAPAFCCKAFCSSRSWQRTWQRHTVDENQVRPDIAPSCQTCVKPVKPLESKLNC